MRFPDIPFMKPVFDLIMGPTSPIAGMLTIIPYVMNNPNDLSFYNGIIKTSAELNVDLHPSTLSTLASTLPTPSPIWSKLPLATSKSG